MVDDVSDDINATDYIKAHREYERKRKDIQRKKDNLRNFLKKIDTMNCTEKETVLVKSFNESNMSFPYETMEAELGRCLLRYLKTLDCRSVKDRNQYCVILHNVYGEKIFTTDITTWLAKCLDTRPCCIKSMMQFWLDTESIDTRGKWRALRIEIKNVILSCWNLNSIVTVDRRNGRDVISMKKIDFDARFGNLEITSDIVIECGVSKRGTDVVKTTKRIAMKTVRQINTDLETKEVKVSIGPVMLYKPFYIGNPSERERHACVNFV